METHLVDGFLARSLSFIGAFLYLVPYSRLRMLKDTSDFLPITGKVALGFGWIASILIVNTIVLTVSDPGQTAFSLWQPELHFFYEWLGPALLDTQAGHWWIANLAVLILASLFESKTVLSKIG